MNATVNPRPVRAAPMYKFGGAPGSAQILKFFESLGPVILLVVVVAVIAIIKHSFILPANLLTVGLQGSVNAVLSIGMTLAIVSGGIDLSVGTMMSLSMVIMAICTNNLGIPMYGGMMICVLVALVGGLINGLLIAYANIPAFITTLGMLGIAQGLALKLSGGYSMYGFPDWYGFIGNGELAGVPFPIWLVWTSLFRSGSSMRKKKRSLPDDFATSSRSE